MVRDVIDKICEYYDVDTEGVLDGNRKHKYCKCRDFANFILHCHYGISIGKLSKTFNCSPRNICKRIAIVKTQIKFIPQCNKEYSSILGMLNIC